MPDMMALIRRSNEKIIPQPCPAAKADVAPGGTKSRARSGPWRSSSDWRHNTENVRALAISLGAKQGVGMSQRRAGRHALIIGGSMSGLLAAIMLERRGWRVDVFERVESELAGRGAGIVAQRELIARLTALGLDVRDLGLPIARRQIIDRAGEVT